MNVALTIVLIPFFGLAVLLAAAAAAGAWSLAVGEVPRLSRQGLKVAVATGLCFALANILAEFVLTCWIGGEAWRGRIDGDVHYVASHGHLTQVSATLWRLKHWQEMLTVASLPLLVPGLVWAVWLLIQERLLLRGTSRRGQM
jgi:hypothetical protein